MQLEIQAAQPQRDKAQYIQKLAYKRTDNVIFFFFFTCPLLRFFDSTVQGPLTKTIISD